MHSFQCHDVKSHSGTWMSFDAHKLGNEYTTSSHVSGSTHLLAKFQPCLDIKSRPDHILQIKIEHCPSPAKVAPLPRGKL
eukprot:6191687-Pleurochrysis_carterae.AAC.2